ncbi:MAG TPA: fumarylacetoacetate hydrolase family protein [Verrucomicrobiae bacterium]
MRLRWQDLSVPLPELQGPAWAWALTYPTHQNEARLTDIFSFEKCSAAESTWASIQHRPSLDYEAELALLLRRGEPERFGFLFANDLTDRAMQLQTYDRRRPAAGFSKAKSFPGALRVGPLLAISGSELWPELEVRLEVNGALRQHVKARECLLTPREFHQQVFADESASDWVLALTGTTNGTIFQSPSSAQKSKLILQNGFSTERAREAWLRQFQFLSPGDRLEMNSEILGTSHATIVAST